MSSAYTPPEARRQAAARVRAFCDAMDAAPKPAAPPSRRFSWVRVAEAAAAVWRHIHLVPDRDR